ncbi:hypothetical protein [Dyella sp. RRB7]|uniref:hypothetical protein n=1 Tax=Dyella sp. RRB7 TaxID=2919502 RepID=UPI001FAA6F39|nr:hypothetical protein [Dyella sp. RRB7]
MFGVSIQRASGRRVAIHVVLICFHLGLLMILLRVPDPPRQRSIQESGHARDALRVRLIAMKAPHAVSAIRPPSQPLNQARRASRSYSHPRPAAQSTPPVKPTPAVPVEPTSTTEEQAPDITHGVGYISGGTLLGGQPPENMRRPNLPGSDRVIAQDVHFVDPEKQGVKHVVRTLQHYFGIPDHHCVDVDSWRTLSKQELVDRHLSPEQVGQIAEKYHCN